MEKSGTIVSHSFEDAITKSGFGRFNYILIALSGGLMSCAFVELTSINIVLPVAQCDLDMSTSDKGILSAIGYVGLIMSSHLWGFLADTKGRKATLVPSLVLAFTATFFSSFVNSFWLLVFLRFMNGFFIACASATTFAYLGEFHDAKNRARVLMTTSILYSVISLFFPTVAVLTLNQEWSFYVDFLGFTYKPWRLFLVLCGVPGLLCALVLVFLLPESPKYVFAQGDEQGALQILSKIYQMNTGNSQDDYEVKSIIKDDEYYESSKRKSQNFLKFMWSQTVPLFQGSHLRNILTACFIQFSICNTANGFWTFLPEIFNKISLWTEASRGAGTVCEIFSSNDFAHNLTVSTDVIAVPLCIEKLSFGTFVNVYEICIFYAIIYAFFSFVINYTGKLVLLVAVLVVGGLSAFSLMFLNIPSVASFTYIIMILAGLGISIVNASTVELFPTNMRATAVCFSMMVGRMGTVFGSMVIGIVIDQHCTATFLMPTILLLSSAALAFTIPNIGKRIK